MFSNRPKYLFKFLKFLWKYSWFIVYYFISSWYASKWFSFLYLPVYIWRMYVWVMCCVLSLSRVWLWARGQQPARLLCPWDSPGENTGVGCIPFSRGSSQPRNQTCLSCGSCIGKQILYRWATREANVYIYIFIFFSIMVYYRILSIVPWTIQ